jgi:hypothetical protein
MNTLKEEYSEYWSEIRKLDKQYFKKWQEYFESYGFKIFNVTPLGYGNSFEMEYAGKQFYVSAQPQRYQGVTVRWSVKMGQHGNEYDYKKIMSESGAIKWMKQNNVGNLN